ncbi:MAG TPA: sporulation protein [Ruminococcaceae bacterium]|nr:sporulation protein [Oscillospiraceae bacterium]HBG55147.1 sporulation protein [Oscillospiraceae bacterium]HBQ45676.1 sporulation protein [Oscillospiraceae bacterium]HBT90611.1 sporulation protein [Oscillospiraceae bacterium]HCB91076.1 sporulation protein [Oscillospiraceae bacterium]
MTMGKRQLVLAALVVALGAAVTLNWAFMGKDEDLPATQAVTSKRELGDTLLVNASGTAVSSSGAAASKGKAASGASSSSSAVKTNTAAEDSYFSEARLARQKARDEATEKIKSVLSDAASNDAVKTEATAQAAEIAKAIMKETDIENLLKAKGYSDCVVCINEDECSVVVKAKGSAQDDAVAVKDVVSGQSGFPYDKIKIIERQ